eukprot:scaffold292675_cov23-Tisochrysis_lutea.AAC.1
MQKVCRSSCAMPILKVFVICVQTVVCHVNLDGFPICVQAATCHANLDGLFVTSCIGIFASGNASVAA